MASHPLLEQTFKAEISHIRNASDYPSFPPSPNAPHPSLPPAAQARDPASFAPGFSVTTHVIPAAYPRYSYRASLGMDVIRADDAPPDSEGKQARKKWAEGKRDALVQKSLEIEQGRIKGVIKADFVSAAGDVDNGPLLWQALNRYSRTSAPSNGDRRVGLTIFTWHANGMHKEGWEPTLRHLIAQSDDPSSKSQIRIDEIWSFDATNSGDGALMNAGRLSDFVDWIDHARDVLNFADHYLPPNSLVSRDRLPIHLPRLPSDITARRKKVGVEDRTLVAMGHSFGGCVLANAACARPNLFKHITLMEPVLFHRLDWNQTMLPLVSLLRRDTWSSREEARKTLVKNPFFSAWSPEVLDLYVQYALYDAEDGTVRLKIPTFVEAVSFSHATTGLETWDLLTRLPDNVRIRFIMAENPNLGSKEDMHHMVWRRPTNASNVIIPKSNHLLVQEKPLESGNEVFNDWNRSFVAGRQGAKL